MARPKSAVLISISDEINRLRFVQFPTKVHGALKIVRVDSFLLAQIDATTVATSKDMQDYAYPANTSSWPWQDDLVTGLYRLGMISKKAMDEHLDRAKQNGERTSKRWAAEFLLDNAKALGIELAPEQMAIVAACEPKQLRR